jgi:hypothetical protein
LLTEKVAAPRAALAELSTDAVAALGIDGQLRDRLQEDGLLELPLGKAAALAYRLDGSLDWLAERTRDRGTPSRPDVAFDGERFKRRRRAAKVPEARVREVLGLPLGPYRSRLTGTWEPTLGQVNRLAELLQSEIAQLIA